KALERHSTGLTNGRPGEPTTLGRVLVTDGWNPSLSDRRSVSLSARSGAGQGWPIDATAKASARAPSAHRLFHKRGDLGLFGGSQLAECVLNRPHGAVVDFRLVAEAERLVPDFELPCVLEVTDQIAVLSVCGHSVPRFRCESRCCGCDQSVHLFGNGAIRLLHPGDSRKQLRFAIRL